MKAQIMKLVDKDADAATNNIHRAKSAFRGLTPVEMQENHGHSGKSRQSILDGYQRWFDETQAMKKWLENVPE